MTKLEDGMLIQEIQRRWRLWGVERRIRKYGFTATYVPLGGGVGELAYTTGFQDAVKAPEVVTFGWTMEDANGLLWTVFQALEAGELSLQDREVWDAPWGPVPKVAWRHVHRSQILREYFNISIIHAERVGRRREDIEVFQLVVADANGVMPWEGGYDTNTKPIQPALWQPYSGPAEFD
jgi:hypothetical protein